MSLVEINGKLRLLDFYTPLIEGLIVDIENIDSNIYDIVKIKLSFDEIKNIYLISNYFRTNNDENYFENMDTLNELISEYLFEKVRSVNFYKNTHLYQGSIVYTKGKLVDIDKWKGFSKVLSSNLSYCRTDMNLQNRKISLKSNDIEILKKGEKDVVDVTVMFIFSTNKCIRSYMYNHQEYIQVLSSELTKKYIKNNKNCKRDDIQNNVRLLYVDSIDEFDYDFIVKLNRYSLEPRPIVVLCSSKEVLTEFTHPNFKYKDKLLRKLLIQDSYV